MHEIERLVKEIRRESDIVYQPTPAGLQERAIERYEKMIAGAVAQQTAIRKALGLLGPDGLLDDERFGLLGAIDRSGMLKRLGFWEHHITTMCERAAETARQFIQRFRGRAIHKIKLFGLGGSAAPHDIAAEVIGNFRKSGVEMEVVHADTPNPDYLDGNTLVILSSFSGETEETLHCYETIRDKTDLFVALSKGGALRVVAQRDGVPFIQLPEEPDHLAFVMQPRESVCLQLTATLVFLGSIGLPPGSQGMFRVEDLRIDQQVVPLVREWRARFGPQQPFRDNPAKKLAFFLLYGSDCAGEGIPATDAYWRRKKIPFIVVDRNLQALGHEVRTQVHERAKLNAAYYEAPECLHNLVESMRALVESARADVDDDRFVYYFIRSLDEEPRIRLRLDETIQLVLEGKGRYAVLNAEGDDPYQRALFATYFNAHMTTYLAILNGFDPLPVPTMSWMKKVMEKFPRGGQEERNAQARRRAILELGGGA